MKRIYLCAILLLSLAFSACESDHYFDQVVRNNSSETATLYYYGDFAAEYRDSTVVAAGEEFNLYTFHSRGAQPEGLSCLPRLDSIIVIANSGKRLVKDLFLESNWNSMVEGKRSVEQVCTFVFDDLDLN